jgi:hypothetical protein
MEDGMFDWWAESCSPILHGILYSDPQSVTHTTSTVSVLSWKPDLQRNMHTETR